MIAFLTWLAVWATKLLIVVLVAVLLTEAVLRIGNLGRAETPLEKRVRENMTGEREDRAA